MNSADIISSRLKNHLLTGSGAMTTPQEVVSWMGAMQAQDYNMARWAIGCRLNGITSKHIDELIAKGDIVRTHILRPTWHFVSREDIAWLLPLSAPRVKSMTRSSDRSLGLDEVTITKTNSLIRKELEKGEHLTRQELGGRLKASGVVLDENRRLNHIMLNAELDGVVCSGKIKGKTQTYRLLEDLVSYNKFDKDESLYKLAFKYFNSHSPATLQDFIWWSGLTTADSKRALELIKNNFLFETIDSQVYVINNSTKSARIESCGIHLLPAFDEFLVSYKDRKEILCHHHYKKVITSNGIFKPFIVNDGEIVGTWNKVVQKNKDVINIDYFELSNGIAHETVEEAKLKFHKFLM